MPKRVLRETVGPLRNKLVGGSDMKAAGVRNCRIQAEISFSPPISTPNRSNPCILCNGRM